MTKSMRVIFAVVIAFFSVAAFASGGGADLQKSGIDPSNINSLQRGARNFMNYCSGCHSAKYVRYNTIGKYLQLTDEDLVNNLMFNAEKTFETIEVSMRSDDAARWFGTAPPDMSLMARSKGADYIFNFLKGFYLSSDSPTGVDNTVLKGTSMPHVLWELQGFQELVHEAQDDGHGANSVEVAHFEPVTAGSLSAEEYDEFVRDTTNFLAYIAEPIRSDRRKLGVWVIMFLLFFLIIASMLKKQIWKDVT